MTDSPLQLGLIGAGRIGQVHAATITQRVERAVLVAVADVNIGAAQACAARSTRWVIVAACTCPMRPAPIKPNCKGESDMRTAGARSTYEIRNTEYEIRNTYCVFRIP